MISFESWHYRYVGREAAEYMKEHNLCLEEFVEAVQIQAGKRGVKSRSDGMSREENMEPLKTGSWEQNVRKVVPYTPGESSPKKAASSS